MYSLVRFCVSCVHFVLKQKMFVDYKQDTQLSQRDRAAGCVIVFVQNRRLELGDDIFQTL